MQAIIGKHTKDQARKRGITEEGIMAILNEMPVIFKQSNHDPDAIIVLGVYEGKVWAVILNHITKHTITVRRAWTKEEKYYDEKKRN